MGMITTVCLEEGLCFGPLPTDWMIADPAYLIAQTTTDVLPELPTLLENPKNLSEQPRLIEWVCNLRSARCPTEQNVELVRAPATGQSFYRIMRRIEAGQEMFVWFRRADIEPLLRQHSLHDKWLESIEYTNRRDVQVKQTMSSLHCHNCRKKFEFIYPFISHCLFQCGRNSMSPLAMLETIYTNEHCDEPQTAFENALQNRSSMTPPNSHWSKRGVSKIRFEPNVEVPQCDSLSRISGNSSSQTLPQLAERLHNSELLTVFDRISSTEVCTSAVTTYGGQNNEVVKSPTSMNLVLPLHNTKRHTTVIHSSAEKSSSASLKSQNPLVQRLLNALSQNLSKTNKLCNSSFVFALDKLVPIQNWCARCFMTFKLTGDLVQHMRTCHDRGFRGALRSRTKLIGKMNKRLAATAQTSDVKSMRKQPNRVESVSNKDSEHEFIDQLACQLCGESFRERHHLTRHMTSHD